MSHVKFLACFRYKTLILFEALTMPNGLGLIFTNLCGLRIHPPHRGDVINPLCEISEAVWIGDVIYDNHTLQKWERSG